MQLSFKDRKLLAQAFVHDSYLNEAVGQNGAALESNERLEFLGDAVLGSVVAEVLFKLYPYEDEGFLTELRSKIVSRVNLNQLARKLGFDKLIEYDSRMLNSSRQGSLPHEHSRPRVLLRSFSLPNPEELER